MTLKHVRIAYLLVCAAISALVVPRAICYEGGVGLWAGGSCSLGDKLVYWSLFGGISLLAIYIAVMVWREDW